MKYKASGLEIVGVSVDDDSKDIVSFGSAHGGAKFPLETLRLAGVDMTTPAPIESTLALFDRRLTELEQLLL